MLELAINWRGAPLHMSPEEVRTTPGSARYVTDWPRAAEVGLIAEANKPLGAAWWRFFPIDAPGYGVVDPAIPEIAIVVIPGARRSGVGGALLAALIDAAQTHDLAGLSLSAHPENFAVQLYERHGFSIVRHEPNAMTMALRFDR